jgi:hypothetical protein
MAHKLRLDSCMFQVSEKDYIFIVSYNGGMF